jgi:hypothetical protein
MAKKKKERWVKVCPKCGSKGVVGDDSVPVFASTGLFNSIKKCENCGHTGVFFPEVPKNKAPKKTISPEKVKSATYFEPTYGQGAVEFLKVLGPVCLAIGLLSIIGGWNSIVPGAFYIGEGLIMCALGFGRPYFEKRPNQKNILLILMLAILAFILTGTLIPLKILA